MGFQKKLPISSHPMGFATHPIPSHGICNSSHPIPWDLQLIPWDPMGFVILQKNSIEDLTYFYTVT
jgi:hypothetical protein